MPTNGTLSFAYGESVQTITVTLTADSTPEPDEQFTVELSNPLYAAIVGRSGTCLITEAHVKVNVGDADAAVTFHTVAGRHYAVEFSPDLATWAVVEGAGDVTGVGGAMIIYDRGVGRSGARYYRTRILAP